MNTSSSPSKKLHSIPEKRLALYGVAAGAALAAGISQTDAALITLDLSGLSIGARTTPTGGSLFFDVNAASATAAVGTMNFAGADFYLSNTGIGGTSKAGIERTGSTANGIAITSIFVKASRFTTSESVSPTGTFNILAKIGSRTTGGSTFGSFGPGDTGFIGLRFAIAPADIHFGWANITLNPNYTVTLNALGYESDALTPAHVEPAAVPEPSAIALLALGAAGVAAFRRRQAKTA